MRDTTQKYNVGNYWIKLMWYIIKIMSMGLIIIILYYLFGNDNENNPIIFPAIILVLIVIQLLPVFILHFIYLSLDKYLIIKINKISGVILYQKHNQFNEYLIKDIEKIIITKPFVRIPWSGYYYVQVRLKNKEEFMFTSLLYDDTYIDMSMMLFGKKFIVNINDVILPIPWKYLFTKKQ